MPAFDVTIQGKRYHVEIPDPGANPLRILVDGQAFDVGIVGSVSEERAPAPLVQLQTGPLPPIGQTPATAKQPPPVSAAPPPEMGKDAIAPMPGTIISLEVAPGDTVDTGQVLCVLEAMKMKNPIRAARAGTVQEIFVKVGQAVTYGDSLVRLA